LLLIAMFVPAAILVAIFLLPVPFVLYASRYDWKPSLLMFAVAILFTLLFATYLSLPITILVGIAGIMIVSAIHHGLSPYEPWGRGAIGFIAGLVLVFLFMQFILQVNLINVLNEMFDESMEMSQDIIGQFGLANQAEDQLALIQEQMSMVMDLIPVGLAFVAIALAFITQWVSYKIMNRLENKQLKFPPFRSLRFTAPITMEMSQDIIGQFGLANQAEDQLALIQEQMSMVMDLIPVGLAFVAIALAFITQWVSYKIMNRLENKQLKFPPFRSLRFPAAI